MSNRLGAVLCLSGLVLTACGSPPPGRALDWSRPAPVPSRPNAAVETALPVSPSATPMGPAQSVWAGLNHNTGEVARGEYAIVLELQQVMRHQIEEMLRP